MNLDNIPSCISSAEEDASKLTTKEQEIPKLIEKAKSLRTCMNLLKGFGNSPSYRDLLVAKSKCFINSETPSRYWFDYVRSETVYNIENTGLKELLLERYKEYARSRKHALSVNDINDYIQVYGKFDSLSQYFLWRYLLSNLLAILVTGAALCIPLWLHDLGKIFYFISDCIILGFLILLGAECFWLIKSLRNFVSKKPDVSR